ncbi:MAG: hypothetical protein A3G28_02090 [Betaproteobacteria bacterium RIFCSPLOWO2_12_FULL_68_19]|nr:MAG: hypothetical protein A3G28_02090 [Betaproteobacteria bacterium RIFCSPLOWO2_12_FULL_68_19]
MTLYESDLTKFMKEFLEQHPEEVESQKKGRAIWWDKSPEERSPHPSMRHAPRSGGAEHTFVPSGGGAEYTFEADDNGPEKPKQA